MKKISKLIYILSLIIGISYSLSSNYIYAANNYDSIDSTNTTSWKIKEEEKSNKYGVYYSHMVGNATTKNITGNEKNINYFSMKTDGENSKLVTWAMHYSTQFMTARLSTIAKDYEKNHPGWIVVAGINADQWYYSTSEYNPKGGYFYYSNQSYYPFTMDHQNLFTINPLGNSGNGIAITNDSTKPFLEINSSSTIQLQIYDTNDNLIATYPVNGYNQASSNNNITVWSGYYSSSEIDTFVNRDISSSNNIYIVEQANLAYMNNTKEYPSAGMYHPTDSFYGRGKISTIATSTTLTKGQFAIDTTNEEVISNLKIGNKVIVEQQYDGISENVESATGYHTVQVKNGVYQSSTAAYNTSSKARSFFGIKKDGTYFLMTTRDNDLNGGGGTVHTETNAILSYYNAYTCYQDDGGGSSTAIYRNQYGDFDVVSTSTDSGKTERNVFSGLFFVVRDPGYKSERRDSTPESVTLLPTELASDLSNVEFQLDGKTYSGDNKEVVIHGLKENTEYEINVKYIYNGSKYQTKMYATTKSYQDVLNFIPTHKGFEVVNNNSYENLETRNIKIYVDENEYIMDNNINFSIDNLDKNRSYRIYYTYDIYNTITQESYSKQTEEIILSTLEKEPPKIITFEEYTTSNTTVKIKYNVSNPDKFLIDIYMIVNNQVIKLEEESGIYTFTNLHLNYEEYQIKLKVEFIDYKNKQQILESNLLTYGQTCNHHWQNATCEHPKTCTICGVTEGELGDHTWVEATKKAPKTCTICGVTEGEKLKGCNCGKEVALVSIITTLILSTTLFIKKKK